MYQALYRKYRSQTFSEMVGQAVISTTLKQAVESQKISHAYLFSGPRGTGKTSAAKIFAKAMNCPNQVDGEPCNQCDLCLDITSGTLEDVIEIDAASNNGVDEIRDIRDKSTYAPSRATYKVYIIDEVHMLSTGAFNALLKTLEEPTENVVFILATTELHKIPATILSRVQRFEFKAITLQDIKNHLCFILDQEGIDYEEEALSLIARRAEGGMRDALSILDQALSLSGDQILRLTIAEEITGAISLSLLESYVGHLKNKSAVDALSDLDSIFESGKSMSRFATDLLQFLRDILVAKLGGQSLWGDNELDHETVFAWIAIITSKLVDIKSGIHPKIHAEMMTVQLAELSRQSKDIPDNVQEELRNLRSEVAELKQALNRLSQEGASNTHSNTVVKKVSPQRFKVDRNQIFQIMEETVHDSQRSRAYLDALKGAWNEILDSISVQNRALLLGSEPVLANQDNAILAFDAAFNAEQAMNRTDLNDMFGNIMSQAAGFSPKIIAVPKAEFNAIRTEFAQTLKRNKTQPIQEKESPIPDDFAFLSEKVIFSED